MKKWFQANAIAIQVICLVALVLEIVASCIFSISRDTTLGDICFGAMLWLMYPAVLSLFVMPYCFVVNIVACRDKEESPRRRTRRIVWAVLSPLLYVPLYLWMSQVFVGVTGGV